MRTPDSAGGCFTKGTLVHTREGLRPIEEIKVGDYVLSSPEDGTGQPEYKQVVNTFVFRDKIIKQVGFTKHVNEDYTETVASTGDHPFWVEGVGWTRADALKGDDKLRKADGSLSLACNTAHIFRIPEWHPGYKICTGLGWVFDNSSFVDCPNGILCDYENHRYDPDNLDTFYYPGDLVEENYLKATVYNLEVEDFHTYYVGETGIWVHNNNFMVASVIRISA
jgi:hypothetical protein